MPIHWPGKNEWQGINCRRTADLRIKTTCHPDFRTAQEVENEVLAGRVDWVNMVKSTRRALREEQARDKPDINLDDLSDDLTKVPTLIYDGPFSDHINERQPQGLKGEEVSRETARERVRDFIDGADGNKFSVSEEPQLMGE